MMFNLLEFIDVAIYGLDFRDEFHSSIKKHAPVQYILFFEKSSTYIVNNVLRAHFLLYII